MTKFKNGQNMQVDFYLINAPDQTALWHFVARLIEKIYHKELRIQIVLPTQDLETLNQYLWTYRADSFLPHDIWQENNGDLPILLHDHPEKLSDQHPILLNLTDSVMTASNGIERIAEIVNQQNPEALGKSRERYRAYQKMGYLQKTHTLP